MKRLKNSAKKDVNQLVSVLKRQSKRFFGILKNIPHLSPLCTETLNQQRLNERFHIKGGVIVHVGEKRIEGRIIDISRSGAAFYMDDGEIPEELFNMDITIKDKGFSVKEIPCKKVASTPVAGKDFEFLFRCSVKFYGLSGEQLLQISHLIEKYADSFVPPSSSFLKSRQHFP